MKAKWSGDGHSISFIKTKSCCLKFYTTLCSHVHVATVHSVFLRKYIPSVSDTSDDKRILNSCVYACLYCNSFSSYRIYSVWLRFYF